MKLTIFLGIFTMFCFSCSMDSSTLVRNQSSGTALGTTYNIIYLTKEEEDFKKEIDSVFSVINQSLSTYIPESDISKINMGDTTIRVDHMFKEVFNKSKKVYDNTNGYFDPTVGTLVNAWGFGPEEQVVMDSLKVDSLLNFVGFDKVSLTLKGIVVKEDPRIYFDFNAIAKGYAIDRIAMMLDKKKITNYLVEVGGELVAKGKNQIKDKAWLIAIDDPQSEKDRKPKIMLNLNNKALASSGNYRKFRIDEETGKKYVHTVDPKTGYTKNSNTLGVTILANDCATADAYATAFMAMDLDEAFKTISSNSELEAYIIYFDAQGKTQEFLTKGFKELVVVE